MSEKDPSDMSRTEIQQEVDSAAMEQMRVGERVQELKAEQQDREQQERERRWHFLPAFHPQDSLALDHCVKCGRLLREWHVDRGYHSYDRPSREGLKVVHRHISSNKALGGLRCEDCHDTLIEKILAMLEKEEEEKHGQ